MFDGRVQMYALIHIVFVFIVVTIRFMLFYIVDMHITLLRNGFNVKRIMAFYFRIIYV